MPVRVTRGALIAHGILMHLLAAEPLSPAGSLFLSQCPCGTILLTLYSMVFDLRVSRAGLMLFYWPKLLYSFCFLLFFSFSLQIGVVKLGSLD